MPFVPIFYVLVTFFFKTTIKRKSGSQDQSISVLNCAVVRRQKTVHVDLREHIFIKSHWIEIFIMDSIFIQDWILFE